MNGEFFSRITIDLFATVLGAARNFIMGVSKPYCYFASRRSLRDQTATTTYLGRSPWWNNIAPALRNRRSGRAERRLQVFRDAGII